MSENPNHFSAQPSKTPTTASNKTGGGKHQQPSSKLFETSHQGHSHPINSSQNPPLSASTQSEASLLVFTDPLQSSSSHYYDNSDIINPYSTPVEEGSATHYDESTTINTSVRQFGRAVHSQDSSESISPRANAQHNNESHFTMVTTPASFRVKPSLNVDIPNSNHNLRKEAVTSSAAKFSFGETKTGGGSVMLKRNQSKPSTPIKVDEHELQRYDDRISMDITNADDGLLENPPALHLSGKEEDVCYEGVSLTNIPSYLLRPSESMESISSLVLDPTMQPSILEDEYLKKLAEKQFTNSGNSAIGKLFQSAHNLAHSIEKKTGVSLKERMPMVFSSKNLEEKPSFFKRATKKLSAALETPRILLPSQSRTLRAYNIKRIRNTLRFQRKVQKAKEKQLKGGDEEEMIDGADVSVETDSTCSGDEGGTAMLRISEEEPVSKPKTKLQKVIGSFKYFFTGQSEKNQSRVLYKDLSSDDRKKVHSLLIDLAYALSIYGLSSYKVEYHLTLISTYYGIDAYFSVNTSGIWIGLGHRPKESNDNMFTYFIKLEGQTVNMDKLAKLDRVASNISHGHYTIDEAQAEVNRIIQEPVIYSHPMINLFFHFLTPGLFVLLWKGTLAEVFTCLLIGLIIGVVNFFFSKMPIFSTIIPAVASLIGGLVGIFMKWVLFDQYYISVSLIALCTSYQFLPGSVITVALSEISIGASLSGVIRLTNAFSIILKLGFGLIFTAGIVSQIPLLSESEDKDIERVAIPIWLRIIVVLSLSLATMISRKVPSDPKIVVAVLGSSLAAHLLNYSLSFLKIEISTVLAAVVVGLLANIFTLFTHHPPVLVAGVAVLMLSPGSMSYRGMASFIYTNNTQAGMNFFLDVFLVGIAIFIGLTIANHVIPIRQKINM